MTDAPFTLNGARIVLRDWREVNLAPFAAWLQPGHRWKELDGPYYPLPSAGDVTADVRGDVRCATCDAPLGLAGMGYSLAVVRPLP